MSLSRLFPKISALFTAILAVTAFAADKSIPYLGPGSDKLTPEQYEKVYRDYIQESILLGYPFMKESAPPCVHSLKAIFRQVGMLTYPVPSNAPDVKRKKFSASGFAVEVYSLGGVVIQVVRSGKTKALSHLLLANATTTESRGRVLHAAEKQILHLTRDKATGLEKVSGVPVGYPHHFLTTDSQGIFVKILRFNESVSDCRPVSFSDNSWVGGFALDNERCGALQTDVENVWVGKLSPQDFSDRALKAMIEDAKKNAKRNGASEKEADQAIQRNFVPPFTNAVNVVGLAMRNLAQCNQLALTAAPQLKEGGEGERKSPNGAGSAK